MGNKSRYGSGTPVGTIRHMPDSGSFITMEDGSQWLRAMQMALPASFPRAAATDHLKVSGADLATGITASTHAVVAMGGNSVVLANPSTSNCDYSLDGGKTYNSAAHQLGGVMTGIAYGAGVFVAVGVTSATGLSISTSPTGAVWTARTSLAVAGMTGNPAGVAFGNGVFILVSNSTTNPIQRSTNGGVTWTAPASLPGSLPNGTYNQIVTDGNGTWLIGHNGGTSWLKSTDNGLNWVNITVPAVLLNLSNQLAYANGYWAYIANGSSIYSTNDLVTWKQRSVPGTQMGISYLASDGTNLVASLQVSGSQAYQYPALLLTADGGVTWIRRQLYPTSASGTACGIFAANGGKAVAIVNYAAQTWGLYCNTWPSPDWVGIVNYAVLSDGSVLHSRIK